MKWTETSYHLHIVEQSTLRFHMQELFQEAMLPGEDPERCGKWFVFVLLGVEELRLIKKNINIGISAFISNYYALHSKQGLAVALLVFRAVCLVNFFTISLSTLYKLTR